MNSKCFCTGWSLAAGLAASVLALPSFAAALTLDEALRLAEYNAPSLAAQDAKIQAASSAAIPAGELPDPKLLAGMQNYPIGGPDRWSINDDFMTMQMVGVRQEMPNGDKRKAVCTFAPLHRSTRVGNGVEKDEQCASAGEFSTVRT